MDIGLPIPWGIVPAERTRVPVDVANPAAGADWSVRTPGGKLWMVLGFRATLATSAVVANRQLRVSITDGAVERANCQAITATITANLTATLGGYRGAVPGGAGSALVGGVGLPDWPLDAGWTFGVVTVGLDAGDQWSAIRLVVEQYEVRGLERAAERYARAVADAYGAG